jgi:hypothetical protein
MRERLSISDSLAAAPKIPPEKKIFESIDHLRELREIFQPLSDRQWRPGDR